MTRAIAPRPRASLIGRPQRLGILPTWWFWNDRRRQRLLLPLILVTALPLGPLVVVAAIKLHLSIWLIQFLLIFVYPTILMGFVERHIRGELDRRIATGEIDGAAFTSRSGTNRSVGLVFALIGATLALGALTQNIPLAVGLGLSGLLLWLTVPPVRRLLMRLGQTGKSAALGEGDQS